MIDKEEIMWSVLGKQPKNKEIEPSEVLLCMDEYAKEVAIDFNKWVDRSGYTQASNDKWESLSDFSGKTNDELFNKYLKQKS